MIKAVLFDLDGTLANTILDLANAVNYALRENGFKEHTVEEYKQIVGSGIPNLLERSLPEDKRSEENKAKIKLKFFEYYSVHFCDNTLPYEGICELLSCLKKMGLSLAVVTNKAQSMTDLVIGKLFGNELFASVIGKREENPVKPDPKPAFIAISELGVNPDECVFVGDSGVDILTARNCGALPVGVLWGFRSEAELKANGARFTVDMPNGILELIKAING